MGSGVPGGAWRPGETVHPSWVRRAERMAREGATTDLDTWTHEELFARARLVELPGRSHMTRRELIEALREH